MIEGDPGGLVATPKTEHKLPVHLEIDEMSVLLDTPDVVRAVEAQTGGTFVADDFMPLPCAHPNCHTLTYAYRTDSVFALIDPGCPVVAVDADRFFVRPSPSLARGVEILARIFHGIDLAAG